MPAGGCILASSRRKCGNGPRCLPLARVGFFGGQLRLLRGGGGGSGPECSGAVWLLRCAPRWPPGARAHERLRLEGVVRRAAALMRGGSAAASLWAWRQAAERERRLAAARDESEVNSIKREREAGRQRERGGWGG